MDAIATKFLPFLAKPAQFEIPLYQRTYSWGESHCEKLWEDILAAGQPGGKIEAEHFIGSIVFIRQKSDINLSVTPQLLVIDGQQRLTTVLLIISALIRNMGERPMVVSLDDGSKMEVKSEYLKTHFLQNSEEGELQHKLLLTKSDKELFKNISLGRELSEDDSGRLVHNLRWFEGQLKGDDEKCQIIYRGLQRLSIVEVCLYPGDDPQLIFESLNSTGLDLSQADLIRNFVLMGLQKKEQESLYEEFWYPLEELFGRDDPEPFNRFMRDYLTLVKTEGGIPNESEVYEEFKVYRKKSGLSDRELFADIHLHGGYYTKFALEREADPLLLKAFRDINELEVRVSYPFLLELYRDYKKELLTSEEFLKCLRLVESYVFRRWVFDLRTNSLNKTFANLGQSLRKDSYLESLQVAFVQLKTYKKYPTDEEFQSELVDKDMYNTSRRNYWLRRVENYDRKERINPEGYTIEHILPQNPNLSKAWQEELGEDWEEVHLKYLHTIGNLTLTAYNQKLSDRPFIEKRDMDGGYADSAFRLNDGIRQAERWNEDAITARAVELSKKAVKVWFFPALSEDVLSKYSSVGPEKAKPKYTLEKNHPHLESGHSKELFVRFRNQVLSLDNSVSEVILKQYIAYKLDTNFVDVVPQAKALKLYLNMPPEEIDDPKDLSRDVRLKGTWGNGDIEVTLSSLEELPDVMGLVRQSFEMQVVGYVEEITTEGTG